MHTTHDQIAKQLLQAILEAVGPVRLEQEVAGDAQRADVCFTSDPERREQRLRGYLAGVRVSSRGTQRNMQHASIGRVCKPF